MSLAIAFGARGRGRANAHFELARNVINLTKMSGAGSLAHEWGHAFDFKVGQLCGRLGLYSSAYVSSNTRGISLPVAKAFNKVIHTMRYKEKTDEQILAEFKSGIEKEQRVLNANVDELIHFYLDEKVDDEHRNEYYDAVNELRSVEDFDNKVENLMKLSVGSRTLRVLLKSSFFYGILRTRNMLTEYMEQVREYELKGRFKGEINREVRTDFYDGALDLDKGGRPYYSDVSEMFARSFESFVEDTAKRMGFVTQYLVHSTTNEIYKSRGFDIVLYPEDAERESINGAIKELIEVYRQEVLKGDRISKDIEDLYKDCGKIDIYGDERNLKNRVRKAVNDGSVSKNSSTEEIKQAIEDVKASENNIKSANENKRIASNDKKVDELASINTSADLRAYISSKVSSNKNITPKYLYSVMYSGGTSVVEMQIPVKSRLGNSQAWGVYKGNLAILESETDAKKSEAVIEAVTRLKLQGMSNSVEGKMVIEGAIFTVCKKAGLDVRTYMMSNNFDELVKNKKSLTDYLNIVIKKSAEICKNLKI